jgi:hypothetical protein
LNPAVGTIDQVTGRVWSAGGNASVITTAHGKAVNFDGVDDYLEYNGYSEITGNAGTLAIWFPRVGATDDFGHMYLAESTGTWFTQYHTPSGTLYFAGVGSTTPLAGWYNTTNRSMVLTTDGTAAGTKCYIDGADYGLAWSSTPASWPSGSKLIHIGNYSGAATIDTDGSMLSFAYASRSWGAAEAKEFHVSKGLSLYKAPSRKIWVVPAANSSGAGSSSGSSVVAGVGTSIASSVGSSSGAAAVSGTGASTSASVGSSDGVSTVSGVGTSSTGSSGSSAGTSSVSGVGSSTADSVASSSGVASASGVGASVAASVGSSDGVATVSGVGDSSIPGSSVGSASGSSSVSGVGASVAASVGSASGSSSAVAVSDNGSLSQGGDDFPGIVIEKRRKKTLAEQPNLHLQSIIDKAAREVLPITPKRAPTKTLSLKKAVLPITPEPEAGNPVAAINQEVVAAEAEKVAALLAQYQEQVKRREMEEDEELLLLIMGAF